MRLFVILFFALNSLGLAIAKEVELSEKVPSYNTEHTMILLNRGSSIFAINLPTYNPPHDMQIVYKVENPDIAFLELIRNAELITIKPHPFDIQNLMNGAEITITADIYEGDYRQSGSLIYSNREIIMSEKLYSRKLNDLAEPSQWQDYDLINLGGTERIYIHKIQKAPSYNHLIFVDLVNACMQKFRTSKRVPAENELTYKFINCGTLKPLYYNADDFKK